MAGGGAAAEHCQVVKREALPVGHQIINKVFVRLKDPVFSFLYGSNW